MNNFQQYGPRDLATLPEGDAFFIGVDERVAPQMLPAGYVAAARNKRFRNGRAATRDGITLLPWLPVNGKTPWTEVYGGAVFNDPNQSGQWILIAADGGVWKTRPGYVANRVPLPVGVTLTAGTFRKLVQCKGGMLLLRGTDQDCLVMEDLEEGFKPIQQNQQWGVVFDHGNDRVIWAEHNLLIGDPVRFSVSPDGALPATVTAGQTYFVLETPDGDSFTLTGSPGDDTARVTWSTGPGDVAQDPGLVGVLDGAGPIAPADDGIFTGNRAVLIESDANGPTDLLEVSDIGDVTRYAKVGQTFRINEGDSYKLVTVRIFNEDTLICFKQGNVKKVTGLSGDLSQAVGPVNVTEAYGAICAGAVSAYGNEIYWLNSELRIASLGLTALNQEQGTDVALSDPVVKTFGRINAAYVSAARTAVHDGFLLVALPLDEAELLSHTELVPGGSYGGPGAPYPVPGLTAGKTYRYEQGSNDDYLVNGTETLYGSATFVAQSTGVDLYGLAAGPKTGSVKEVLASGINNGVAVYDFLNQAWAGTDEAEGVTVVKDWLKFEYGGRPRLGFIGADGWLHLYGEGYEDEKLVALTVPYVDVLVYNPSRVNEFGATLQVNGGSAVAMFGETAAKLWNDAGAAGYDPTVTVPWTAPSTAPEQIADGVRFVATNGVLPAVKVNGSVLVDGVVSWAFVDSHSGSEIQGVAISDKVRTRAFLCERRYGQNPAAMVKRYRSVAAQVGTWSPSYTVVAIVQGQGTDNQVAPLSGARETRDRTKYFTPFDRADYDVTNVNDDFFARGREDYSVVVTNLGFLIGSGMDLDALQEYVHRVDVNESGLWLQLEIENTDGRLELLAVAMEGEEGYVLSGPQVG